jgi:hypothetical protein
MAFLFDPVRRELELESAIDRAVITERGYESIHRPTNGDQRRRERLSALGIPSWATKEDAYFPGLLIPMYGPTGRKISYQWKPRRPVPDRDGKPVKIRIRQGPDQQTRCAPSESRQDRGPNHLAVDYRRHQKGGALTSRGLCVISLTGVFNWRSTLGTLGDWEDVPLKGRNVVLCFDADARTNPNVLRAMVRLGHWLKSKQVAKVTYLVVPREVNGQAVKVPMTFWLLVAPLRH